jgi:hypothetical protein
MALIEDEPPKVLPRGQYMRRSLQCFCGVVS